ncbi:unnamed protein product, partial [Amoebophrya sp. A120]
EKENSLVPIPYFSFPVRNERNGTLSVQIPWDEQPWNTDIRPYLTRDHVTGRWGSSRVGAPGGPEIQQPTNDALLSEKLSRAPAVNVDTTPENAGHLHAAGAYKFEEKT